MRKLRNPWLAGPVVVAGMTVLLGGCMNTPVDPSRDQGPAPSRMPPPDGESEEGKSYEDSLTGGKVFTMYCSYCHNAPSLAERPYAQFRNVAAHMRVRANLTGKEYAKLMEWVRRWHDVPPQNPPIEPSPKRFIFSQPIAELRPPEPGPDAKLPPPNPLDLKMPDQPPAPKP